MFSLPDSPSHLSLSSIQPARLPPSFPRPVGPIGKPEDVCSTCRQLLEVLDFFSCLNTIQIADLKLIHPNCPAHLV